MKSTTKTNPVPSKPFPKLMTNHRNGAVVLFTAIGVGMLLNQGSSTSEIGEYSVSFDMDRWKDYNGSVTLSND